jgi:ABC-2 type transport system permease protein
MKVFLSLCNILIKSFYGFTRAKIEKSTKGILKAVGIGALILYGIASVSVVIVLINLSSYKALKPIGFEDMLILNNLLMAVIVTFVFSLLTAMSVYFTSSAERNFQALPLKPWQIFSSKIILVYISEALLSLLIMLPLLVIFGIKEQPEFLFYVYGILGALTIPIIPICVIFVIIVPIMRTFKFMRRRNVIMMLTGFLGICAMIGFQVFYQMNMAQISNQDWLTKSLTGPGAILNKIGSGYPPSYLLWKAMDGAGSISGFIHLLATIGLSAGVFLLVVLLLSKAYTSSLVGFDEHTLKKMTDADSFIGRSFQKKALFSNLVRREINLMNREPVYFFNGPFMVVVFPVILVIMYFVYLPRIQGSLGGRTISELLASIRNTPIAILVPAAFGGLIGSSMMISATSISRDAKFLPQIKSMPIDLGKYGLAKLCHGLIYGSAAIVLGTIPLVIIFKLTPARALLSLMLAAAFIWLTNIGGLYLDTVRPRLKWDNPTAAFKQNMNAFAAVLAGIGLLAAIGIAAYFLKINISGIILGLLLPMAAGSAVLTWRYPGFASKKLAGLEP